MCGKTAIILRRAVRCRPSEIILSLVLSRASWLRVWKSITLCHHGVRRGIADRYSASHNRAAELVRARNS